MEETNISSAVVSRRKRRRMKTRALKIICAVLFLIVIVMGVWVCSLSKTISEKDEQLEQKEKAVVELQTQVDEKQREVDNWKVKYENLSASLNSDAKIAYLTFDDGPSDNTLKILKILEENDACGTFFVTGKGNSDYMKQIVESGNTIALHTYTHTYKQIYANEQAYFDDLQKISDLVYEKTGVRSNLLRFPGGSSNTISKVSMKTLANAVEEKGYHYFDWNCDSGDARTDGVPADKLVENIRNDMGSTKKLTILMHDTAAKNTTVEALPQIIKLLKDKGYKLSVLNEDMKPCHHNIGR